MSYNIVGYSNENIETTMLYRYKSLLEKYLNEILLVNNNINLTSITDYDKAWMLHINDSLLALEEVNSAPNGLLVDIGSGGGFPGVPLSIETQRDALLVDSREKKMQAVATVLNKLGIENIETYSGRIEDLAREPRFECAVVTARALAELPIVMELASPLLIKQGVLVVYKSNNIDKEIRRAETLQEKLGFTLYNARQCVLEGEDITRTIVSFIKDKEIQISLPRRNGLAQKRPLA